MIKSEYAESALTGKIIGCAMEVHKFLGNGFQEVIYQRAMVIEMSSRNWIIAGSIQWRSFIKEIQLVNEE